MTRALYILSLLFGFTLLLSANSVEEIYERKNGEVSIKFDSPKRFKVVELFKGKESSPGVASPGIAEHITSSYQAADLAKVSVEYIHCRIVPEYNFFSLSRSLEEVSIEKEERRTRSTRGQYFSYWPLVGVEDFYFIRNEIDEEDLSMGALPVFLWAKIPLGFEIGEEITSENIESFAEKHGVAYVMVKIELVEEDSGIKQSKVGENAQE